MTSHGTRELARERARVRRVVARDVIDADALGAERLREVGHGTLYPQTNSWYTGTNIAGKVRAFTPYAGGVGTYRRICESVVERGYEGFEFSSTRVAAAVS